MFCGAMAMRSHNAGYPLSGPFGANRQDAGGERFAPATGETSFREHVVHELIAANTVGFEAVAEQRAKCGQPPARSCRV
jgi:hypothetical protein